MSIKRYPNYIAWQHTSHAFPSINKTHKSWFPIHLQFCSSNLHLRTKNMYEKHCEHLSMIGPDHAATVYMGSREMQLWTALLISMLLMAYTTRHYAWHVGRCSELWSRDHVPDLHIWEEVVHIEAVEQPNEVLQVSIIMIHNWIAINVYTYKAYRCIVLDTSSYSQAEVKNKPTQITEEILASKSRTNLKQKGTRLFIITVFHVYRYLVTHVFTAAQMWIMAWNLPVDCRSCTRRWQPLGDISYSTGHLRYVYGPSSYRRHGCTSIITDSWSPWPVPSPEAPLHGSLPRLDEEESGVLLYYIVYFLHTPNKLLHRVHENCAGLGPSYVCGVLDLRPNITTLRC